ncbi:MAG: DNA-directed DNA polymerase II small subunit [Methanobrevibacter sp.]|jgi:DNA polymerase II small subunit|nr:DNA-directed DNA polymerase II small subunit [Candidatus Methanovirga aequatorialis]
MREIIYKFAEKGINISPEVYERIINLENPLIFTTDLILKIRSKFSKKELFHLDEEFLLGYLSEDDTTEDDLKRTLDGDGKDGRNFEFNDNLGNQLSSNASTKDGGEIDQNDLASESQKSHEKNVINETVKTELKNEDLNKNADGIENKNSIKKGRRYKGQSEVIKKNLNQVKEFDPSKCFRNLNSVDREYNFEIIQDTTNKSYTSGEITNLVNYFGNRFEKLSKILSRRAELKVPQKIKDVVGSTEFNIVGMINDIKKTKNGHRMIDFEDDTGVISVLFHKNNQDLFNESEKLVKDEVLGLIGEKKGSLAISSSIVYPGVQRVDTKPMDFSMAFISDVHIGSLNFLDDSFSKFIKWINGDFGTDEQIDMGNDVKYLIIAGDLVDGIGIYPNQDKELAIKDIAQQYEEAARYLGDVRSDVKIILCPGNHDASRVAEPQTAIPEKYAKSLYKLNNIELVSNPAVVNIEGLNTLIYHGRGFDDLAITIKGMSHEKNDVLMEKMLKMRHLAPIYGERTPLASELEDHLVIDEIPDIFHTGHVHINRYKLYNGVHLINSGTFQTQTEFQKTRNITPTAGIVPVLHRGNYNELKFFNGE